MNKLIPLANGKYSCIVDSDDVLEKDFLMNQVSILDASEETTFCYSDAILISSNGEKIGEIQSSEFSVQKTIKESYIPENGLTRTSALKEVLPFIESFKTKTKHHKWLKLVENGAIGHYIPRPLFRYRMHSNNISQIYSRLKNNYGISEGVSYNFKDYWDPIQRLA